MTLLAPQASGEKPGRSDATKIDFEGRIAEVRYFIIATSPPPGKHPISMIFRGQHGMAAYRLLSTVGFEADDG